MDGPEREIVQKRCFPGQRHDNEVLKMQISLSRHFVVIAQAPRDGGVISSSNVVKRFAHFLLAA